MVGVVAQAVVKFDGRLVLTSEPNVPLTLPRGQDGVLLGDIAAVGIDRVDGGAAERRRARDIGEGRGRGIELHQIDRAGLNARLPMTVIDEPGVPLPGAKVPPLSMRDAVWPDAADARQLPPADGLLKPLRPIAALRSCNCCSPKTVREPACSVPPLTVVAPV